MDPNTTLTGRHIRLRPLRAADAEALVQAASDGELWNLPFTIVPSAATVAGYLDVALKGQAAGTMAPFATEHLASGRVIGSTRFWNIDEASRKLEIGHTWLAAQWQRTAANSEAKYLMLRHAFEALNCVRVQFQTDEINEKSRAAILRLGAQQEGLLRKERILPNGRIRNTVIFSLLDGEWPAAKAALERRLYGEAPPPAPQG